MNIMKLNKIIASTLLVMVVSTTAASAAPITITVTLPGGAPAKRATVRMYTLGANYVIHQLDVKTTDASGKAVFQLHPGACFKAEYGTDASGRSQYVHGGCPKAHQTKLTIDLY